MQKLANLRILLLGTGVVVLAAIGKWFILPWIVQWRTHHEVRLIEGGGGFHRWKVIPVPVVLKVYFFNVTNPDEISRGLRPIFKEIGPYVYEEAREKTVEEIREEDDTIVFRPKTTYHFKKELSNGNEDDVLTFLNILLVSIVNQASKMPMQVRYIVKELMEDQQEKLFLRLKVGDYLFKGYKDNMLKALSDLQGEEFFPNSTFSIYGGFNATNGALLEIYSGVKDLKRLGQTKSWDGRVEHDKWSSRYCNMMNGSDGIFHPPFVTRDRVVGIFKPDMCRSMQMTYQKDVVVNGIPGYRFIFPRRVMEGAKENPDNACYCTEPGENYEGCYPTGVFELSPCATGAIAVSWPHFYDGDPVYLNQSVGMRPIKERHESFLVLEPNTGGPLKASVRVQMNSELKRNKYFKLFKNVPTMLFPIFWTDEAAIINDSIKTTLKWRLLIPLQMADILLWIMFGIGFGVILYALLCTKPYLLMQKEKGTKYFLPIGNNLHK